MNGEAVKIIIGACNSFRENISPTVPPATQLKITGRGHRRNKLLDSLSRILSSYLSLRSRTLRLDNSKYLQ